MSYLEDLSQSTCRSLSDILRLSLSQGFISTEDLRLALQEECAEITLLERHVPFSGASQSLIAKLASSPDRDLIIIVKKILRSTRYASATYMTLKSQVGPKPGEAHP